MRIEIGDIGINLEEVNYYKIFYSDNNGKDLIKFYFKNKDHIEVTSYRANTVEFIEVWLKNNDK